MPGFEFYLLMFLLGFLGSAALVYFRTRRGTQPLVLDDDEAATGGRTIFEQTLPAAGRAPVLTPLDQPAVQLDESSAPQIAPMLFAARADFGEKECPTCERRFGERMVVCPFDATPLTSVGSGLARTARPALTGARRPVCPACLRRFEGGAKFCYHDGTSLMTESPDELPIYRACQRCGAEGASVTFECGCDSPEYVELDPSNEAIQVPTIPLMKCRRCGAVAAPGQTHCPDDAELLYPVMNVQINALPTTGLGPRRKLCQQCGRRFSGSARFCAYDGSKLKPLN